MSLRQKTQLYICKVLYCTVPSAGGDVSYIPVRTHVIISAEVNTLPSHKKAFNRRPSPQQFNTTLYIRSHLVLPGREVLSLSLSLLFLGGGEITVTSPSRRGLRHLVCHFSNDGGVKRPGCRRGDGSLKGRKGGGKGGCLHCWRRVLCSVKGRIDLLPLFSRLILLCVFSSTSASLYSSIPHCIPLPLLLWGPIWLKWNLFLIFFLIKI